jgi:hypothetical protein
MKKTGEVLRNLLSAVIVIAGFCYLGQTATA